MDIATIVTIIGIVLGFLQGIIVYILSGIKSDVTKMQVKLDTKVDGTLCSERMIRAKEDHDGCSGDNRKNHDEIFERMRAVEKIRVL